MRYSNVENFNELVRQTNYESSQFDIHPPIKILLGKTEFLADLGYDFQQHQFQKIIYQKMRN